MLGLLAAGPAGVTAPLAAGVAVLIAAGAVGVTALLGAGLATPPVCTNSTFAPQAAKLATTASASNVSGVRFRVVAAMESYLVPLKTPGSAPWPEP